jgi:hypothetical protein
MKEHDGNAKLLVQLVQSALSLSTRHRRLRLSLTSMNIFILLQPNGTLLGAFPTAGDISFTDLLALARRR